MSLANKLSITDVDLKGKRVLIRVCILSFQRQPPSTIEPSNAPITPVLSRWRACVFTSLNFPTITSDPVVVVPEHRPSVAS